MENIITDIDKISAKSNKTIKSIQNMDNFIGEGAKLKSKNKENIDMIKVKKLSQFESDDSDLDELDHSTLNKSDEDDGKNDYLKSFMKKNKHQIQHQLNIDKKNNKKINLNSDDSEEEVYITKVPKTNSKQLVDISIISKIAEDDEDSDTYKDLKMFNAKKTKQLEKIQNIEKSIDEQEDTNTSSKLVTKIEYSFSKIPEQKKYFNYLNNIENKNNRLESFIEMMKEIINEKKIKDVNGYLKYISSIINNYKMIFGYIIYIKDYDNRTGPEILDLFGIISNFIAINVDIIEQSGYILTRKTPQHTVTSLSNEKNPIKYKNIETINKINVFEPIIKKDSFCYLNKYIILEDIINTFMVSWNLIFLHLLICNNIVEQHENEIKKIRDKCLTIVTDTNTYMKSFMTFIKRKPKANPNDLEKISKTKISKANAVPVSDALNNTNILKNNEYIQYEDIDEDENNDNNLDMNDDD